MGNLDQSESNVTERKSIPFQFGIKHLAYVVAVFAMGLSAMGAVSLIYSLAVLLFWLIILNIEAIRESVSSIITILIIMVILVGLLIPTLRPHTGHRRYSVNNVMKCISSAILNYESANLVLPSASRTNEPGQAIHSWRIKMLPYMEQTPLFRSYDRQEPWDGPSNCKLAIPTPHCYETIQNYDLAKDGLTPYKLVIGKGTAPVLSDVTDGTAHTIMLVEDANNPVEWMKPEDLDIDQAVEVLTGPDAKQYVVYESRFKKRIRGPVVAMMDGSVHTIKPGADPELVRQALTAYDGKFPDMNQITGTRVIIHHHVYYALTIWLLTIAGPVIVVFRMPRCKPS